MSSTHVMHVHFGFKNQKLVTVIYTLERDRESGIDCDYYVDDPEEAEKQIAEWKARVETKNAFKRLPLVRKESSKHFQEGS